MSNPPPSPSLPPLVVAFLRPFAELVADVLEERARAWLSAPTGVAVEATAGLASPDPTPVTSELVAAAVRVLPHETASDVETPACMSIHPEPPPVRQRVALGEIVTRSLVAGGLRRMAPPAGHAGSPGPHDTSVVPAPAAVPISTADDRAGPANTTLGGTTGAITATPR